MSGPDRVDVSNALAYEERAYRSEFEVQIDFLRLEIANLTREISELRARELDYQYEIGRLKSRSIVTVAGDRLEQAYLESLIRLVHASAFRDQETGAHIRRIGMYSELMARECGMPAEFADRIGQAAPMHDVGKVGVPDAILHKNGPLTPQEWILMKRHCDIGAQLLSGSPSPLIQMAERIARWHHERFDGTGYPSGAAGEVIPVEARIVMVADVYDALRSPRPYKPSFPHEKACSIILEGDGRTQPQHFDPALLDVFRRLEPDFQRVYEEHADPEFQHL
jgi:putative two-component system response regulator